MTRSDYRQTTYCGATYRMELRVRDLTSGADSVVSALGPFACVGSPGTPRLSPDQTKLAWDVHDSAAPSYVQDLRTGDRRTIERCSRPEWSPDGSKIACSTYANDWTVKIVDATTLETVLTATSAPERTAYMFDWLDDDTLVAAGYDFTGSCTTPEGHNSRPSKLWTVDATTGAFRDLATPECGASVHMPQVSPHGDRFSYTTGHKVYVGDAGTGLAEPVPFRPLGDGFDLPIQAVWSAAGDELIVSVYRLDPSLPMGARYRVDRLHLASGHRGVLLPPAGSPDVDVVDVSSASLPVLDRVAPTVVGVPDRMPDGGGWYRSPVTIRWEATDAEPSAGPPSVPADVLADTEGADVVYTSEPSCDAVTNCAVGELALSLDMTPPSVGSPIVAASPAAVGTSVSVGVEASDSLSGVAGGEVFVGTDPGVGAGTAARLVDGALVADLVELPVGLHTVGVRSRDVAGNWSAPAQAYAVVYDPSGPSATGAGAIVPGGPTSEASDALPGLNGTSRATFGFSVEYKNGATTVPGGSLQFRYAAGHFSMRSVAMDWLVVTNRNAAKFSGTAEVDGADGLFRFRVDARDGEHTGQVDRLVLSLWAPGRDPDTTSPTYVASGDLQAGNIRLDK